MPFLMNPLTLQQLVRFWHQSFQGMETKDALYCTQLLQKQAMRSVSMVSLVVFFSFGHFDPSITYTVLF